MGVLYVGKRRFIYFLLPTMMLASTLYTHNAASNIHEKIIIVDAGHGGIDSGANRTGIFEKNINLAVSLQLKEALHQYGAKTVLSRQTDIELSPECDNEKIRGRYHRDLAARVELAEESDANLFISIHANAVANARRHGAEVFFSAKSKESKALANYIQAELCKVTQTNYTAAAADYFVLRRNTIPAVLIEVGYITNLNERELLKTPEYQAKIAEAIARGIYQFYQQ